MTINQRSKGGRGEREVVSLFNETVPHVHVERNLNQSIAGGDDLKIETAWDIWSIEIKRHEPRAKNSKIFSESTIQIWWNQCINQAKNRDKRPVLFYRGSRMDWKVRVNLNDFLGTPGQELTNFCIDMLAVDFLRIAYNNGKKET